MRKVVLIDIGKKIGGGQVESRVIYNSLREYCPAFICHPQNKLFFGIKNNFISVWLKNLASSKTILVFNQRSLLFSLFIFPFCKRRIFIIQSFPPKKSWLIKYLIKKCKTFTFNSELTKAAWTNDFPDLIDRSSNVIYSPFDRCDLIVKNSDINQRQNSNNPLQVMFVGRAMPRKNFPLFISALVNMRIPYDAHIYGDQKDCFERLREWSVEERNVLESCHFHGFINDKDKMYADKDVLVLPTTDEPFGRVHIEAYVNLVPSICLGRPGAKEIIEDNIKVVAPTSAALARALEGFYEESHEVKFDVEKLAKIDSQKVSSILKTLL